VAWLLEEKRPIPAMCFCGKHSISPSITTEVVMCPCLLAGCTTLGDRRHDQSDRSSEISTAVHLDYWLICGAGDVIYVELMN